MKLTVARVIFTAVFVDCMALILIIYAILREQVFYFYVGGSIPFIVAVALVLVYLWNSDGRSVLMGKTYLRGILFNPWLYGLKAEGIVSISAVGYVATQSPSTQALVLVIFGRMMWSCYFLYMAPYRRS